MSSSVSLDATKSAKLRCLLQVDDFLFGGLENVVREVALQLKSNNFEVALLVLGVQGQAVENFQKIPIDIFQLPRLRRKSHYRALLKKYRPDIVNSHYSIYGAQVCHQEQIPFVQTVHNTNVWLNPIEWRQHVHAQQYTTAYICVSKLVASYTQRTLQADLSQIHVIHNGIDIHRFTPPTLSQRESLRDQFGYDKSDFVFLNVASLVGAKSQLVLIQALAIVQKQFPRVKLILAGGALSSSYKKQVVRALQNIALTASARWVRQHDNPVELYQLADAFVLPSLYEGWSLALTEAACCGLPLIATRVGGAVDLIEQTGGQLIDAPTSVIFEPGSDALQRWLHYCRNFVRDLADAMIETVKNPQPAKVTDQLHASIDRTKVYQQHIDLFKKLINPRT